MKKVLVFGSGLIGSFIANQLNEKYEVAACDGDIDRLNKLNKRITVIDTFVQHQRDIFRLISKHKPDIIVNALPGHIGYKLLDTAIECGKNIVDISFMSEDPLALNEKAVKNGVTAVIDFGFAPGFSHMFVGRANKLLDKHDESIIYVGGLQLNTDDYKAVFSPADVLQEYTRPARYLKDGVVKTELPFDKDYTLKVTDDKGETIYSGFINDGLRTLVDTLNVQTLIEITLRTPKHFAFIQQLKENGFLKKEHLKNTAKVLTDTWKMNVEDRDYSIMHVESGGGGKKIYHFMDDQYDEETGTHSMARVTGFPAIAMVEAILEGKYTKRGVIPPEYVAQNDEMYNYVVNYLRDREVTILEQVIED